MDASGSSPGYQSTGRQVRGRPLHDVLHDPGTGIAQQAVIPLDPSRVALIARAILNALASGAVHGYITPHTIVLTDDGNALLVGDRVAPGATPANDVFALGMALFEAVEGYAPHPAEPLPAMPRAGALAPLIEALTAQDPGRGRLRRRAGAARGEDGGAAFAGRHRDADAAAGSSGRRDRSIGSRGGSGADATATATVAASVRLVRSSGRSGDGRSGCPAGPGLAALCFRRSAALVLPRPRTTALRAMRHMTTIRRRNAARCS